MNNCTGKEAEPEAPAEPEKPKNSMSGLLIFLVVGLLGGGAALYYFKFRKLKQSVKGSTDLKNACRTGRCHYELQERNLLPCAPYASRRKSGKREDLRR